MVKILGEKQGTARGERRGTSEREREREREREKGRGRSRVRERFFLRTRDLVRGFWIGRSRVALALGDHPWLRGKEQDWEHEWIAWNVARHHGGGQQHVVGLRKGVVGRGTPSVAREHCGTQRRREEFARCRGLRGRVSTIVVENAWTIRQ